MFQPINYGGTRPPSSSRGIEQLSFMLGLAASILLSPLLNEWLDATPLHDYLIAKYTVGWAWMVEGGLKLIVFGIVFAIFRAFTGLALTAIMIWGMQRIPAYI